MAEKKGTGIQFGSWNYRIWEKSEGLFVLVEAYYDPEDGSIQDVIEVSIDGESLEECKVTYYQAAEAFNAPVIPHTAEIKGFDFSEENCVEMTFDEFEDFTDVLWDNQDLGPDEINGMFEDYNG